MASRVPRAKRSLPVPRHVTNTTAIPGMDVDQSTGKLCLARALPRGCDKFLTWNRFVEKESGILMIPDMHMS
ncbi:MAG: hypothetical protein ABIF87_16835 [Pseudomonadota bacterium]